MEKNLRKTIGPLLRKNVKLTESQTNSDLIRHSFYWSLIHPKQVSNQNFNLSLSKASFTSSPYQC